MTDDLLPLLQDTSKSCVFGWPDRPGDTLPPEYPPVDPPDCYPYCDIDNWPPPEILPPLPEPPGPLPGSTPHVITEFDIALFECGGTVFHLWFSKIVVSAIGQLTTEFFEADIDDPPFIPPDTGYLYFPNGANASNAIIGIRRIDGISSFGFVNFQRLKASFPLATGFIVVLSIGFPDGFIPGDNCFYSVVGQTGTSGLFESGNGWQVSPPTTFKESVAQFNATHTTTSGFRKVLKLEYEVVTSNSTVHKKTPPV